MNQTLRSPDDLHFHPLHEATPMLRSDAPEMLALIASVETHGCLRPVIINDRDEIIDGRALVYAAKRAGLTELPCLVVPDEEAAAIILDTLCGRRHLSKSALAYLAFPLLEASAEARQRARVRGLKAGKKSSASRLSLQTGKITVEEVAQRLGFDRVYFYKAREVHALFAREPDYKAQMEPLLLTSEEANQVSLRGILAGWTGIQNKGHERRQGDQLDLFGGAFKALRYHFKRTWASMDDAKRAALVPQVRETVAEMPPEVRDAFAAEIKAAEKAAKEAGQKV